MFYLVFRSDADIHQQSRNAYFLNSGDNVSFFFEQDALDEKGELKVRSYGIMILKTMFLHPMKQTIRIEYELHLKIELSFTLHILSAFDFIGLTLTNGNACITDSRFIIWYFVDIHCHSLNCYCKYCVYPIIKKISSVVCKYYICNLRRGYTL